jgi:hypothetical protein
MDVPKFAVRWSAALCAAVIAAAALSATAQETTQTKEQMRHETNASRQARIERTIQDTYTHRWEVFGGGGYLRFRSGDYTKRNNEVSWATAANYYLNEKFAIVADARGSFGNGKPIQNEFITQAPNPQINEYTFTGGVSYRFYKRERFAISVQGLGGVGIGNFSGGAKGLTYQQIGFWQDGARAAFIGNVSGDYNFYPNLAFRFSPTYVGTTFGGTIQNNLGFNAGIIYRFGRQ